MDRGVAPSGVERDGYRMALRSASLEQGSVEGQTNLQDVESNTASHDSLPVRGKRSFGKMIGSCPGCQEGRR